MTRHSLLVKHLIEFGLSEKEAKVYLVLLELEVAAVSEIAKTAEVNRSTAYVVLTSLKKKGLVSVSEDKKVQSYVAASPDFLLHEAENRAKKAEEVKSKINSLAPELKALYRGTKRKPKVRVFEGKTGLKEAYWDVLATPGANELRVYADPVKIFKMFPDFMQQNVERAKRGIKMYCINPATKEAIDLLNNTPAPPDVRGLLAEFSLIPKSKFKFSSDMAVYGNKVALASPKEDFGVIIEDQEIADIARNSFDLAWQEAKRLAKKRDLYRKM